MNEVILIIALILPIIGGACVLVVPWQSRRSMCWFIQIVIVSVSIMIWSVLFYHPKNVFELAHFTGDLTISLQVDGLATIFAGLISVLWPLATIYTFEYMKHEKHEKHFYFFYMATYGVTLGIALASNYLTVYFFYELLTFITVPLVMHTLTREAILASRKYLYYSIGGAAFAFVGLIFMILYGDTSNFVMGGILDISLIEGKKNDFLLIYVLAFFGFGVKAALCPFNAWLPAANIAPTPVTALLHAVAVVKSGAFVIIRLTFYCFGVEFLKGTWAQAVVLIAIIITILYGSSKALKETHLKRRLAYSTISNLSYILFGIALMNPLGLIGALCHLIFHAFMKIVAFFCAGAILYQTDKHYIHQLDGLGYRMPKIFTCFLLSSLGLMGVPGLAGFISKWYLAMGAVENNTWLGVLGIGAILISALLTGIYMLSIVVRAYFPSEDFQMESIKKYQDPGNGMVVPIGIIVGIMIYFGLHSDGIVEYISKVAYGLV